MRLKLREKSFLYKALTVPLVITHNRKLAEKGLIQWGALNDTTFVLRPLGILHGLLGLTVELKE
jgi:hypothetical protein